MIKDRFVNYKTDNERVLAHPYINDVLVFDTENDSLSVDTAELKFIGFYSYKYEKYILVHANNRERIQQLIDEHRVLVGFNNKYYDNPVMENEINQFNLKYKVCFDCLCVLRDPIRYKNNRNIVIADPDGRKLIDSLPSHKLKDVAKTLKFDVAKGDVDYNIFKKNEWSDAEIQEIFTYLYKDIDITRRIFEYFVEYLDGFRDLVSDENIKRFDYIRSSSGSFAYSAICHLAGIELEWEDDPKKLARKPENDGGLVMKPRREYAENCVYLDVASLYPNIMIQCNLFAPVDNGWNGNGFFDLKGQYNPTEHCTISKVLLDMYKRRKKLKQAGDKREQALKLVINTIYGISGSPIFKKVFNMTTAPDCTAIGRKIIDYTRQRFEDGGYELVYGDTDSVFVVMPKDKTTDDILAYSDIIVKELQQHMPFPSDTFLFDVDDVFDKLWMFKKKMYCGFSQSGKFILKGLPVKKSDATQLGQLIYKKLKPLMLERKDIKFDKTFIDKLIDEELQRDITLIGRVYRIKSPDSYKSHTSLQFQIASELGEGNHILIPNKTLGDIGKTKKYCSPEDAKTLTIEELFLDKVYHELEPFIR